MKKIRSVVQFIVLFSRDLTLSLTLLALGGLIQAVAYNMGVVSFSSTGIAFVGTLFVYGAFRIIVPVEFRRFGNVRVAEFDQRFETVAIAVSAFTFIAFIMHDIILELVLAIRLLQN